MSKSQRQAGAIQARAEIRLDELPAKDRLAFWVDQVCAASAQADSEIVDRGAIAGRLKHLQIAELRINEIQTCAQAFRRTSRHMGRADAEVFAILLQRSGSSTISFDGAPPRLLKAGDISINSGMQPGVWNLGEDSEVLLTVVPSALMRRAVGFAHEDGAVPVHAGTPVAQLLALFLDTLRTQAATLTHNAARHLRDGLLQTVGVALEPKLSRAEADTMSRLAAYQRARIQRFFMQHLHDPLLDVAMIARGVHLSPSQIHRLFASAAGERGGGVMHQIWQERLEGSRKTLEARGRGGTSEWSIAEVGWRWGFQSAAHFSRSFKQRFGVTPSEWRAAAQLRQVLEADGRTGVAAALSELGARVKALALLLLPPLAALVSEAVPVF